ncbi:hypothetical protein FMUND_319 [Fusarium mundagurra]|uniref:Uncharacterized protein n=1 Tax=Fusarium mundagurra TaxID=1567541 RepID=A0A8H5Z6T8_9HYPO|nr:hypothetical protein FMUND_319 [Fusarium mundagurra]
MEDVEHHDNRGAESLVDIVDAGGNVIGPVEEIEPWNQCVGGIQELEIRRPIKIRRGRRLNTTHLASIYERTEAKGVKGLSSEVQANKSTRVPVDEQISVPYRPPSPKPALLVPELPPERQPGRQIERQPERQYERQPEKQPERPVEPQSAPQTERQAAWTTAQRPERRHEHQPEKVPDRPNERFHDVIAAKAPERIVEVVPIQIAERPREMSHRQVYGPPTGSPTRPTTAPSPHGILHPSTELDGPARDHRGSDPAHISREPKQIHTPQEYRLAAGFTPANVRSRPPSSDRGRPTPQSLSLDTSSQPPQSPPAQPLEEITRENMVLKNDRNVYTYPECVAGVPLVKINEEHPSWEANWPNVKTIIEPQLARWREKHQAAIEAGPKQDKGGSSKHQIGRQVNRGIKILEFHEKDPISPYQLLGKRYIQACKGGITSYDTLFRLSETISELDMSPVDWMRQRHHELI